MSLIDRLSRFTRRREYAQGFARCTELRRVLAVSSLMDEAEQFTARANGERPGWGFVHRATPFARQQWADIPDWFLWRWLTASMTPILFGSLTRGRTLKMVSAKPSAI
jgi:hypothetical protein